MAYHFETRCIHGDRCLDKNHPYGAVSTPIFQTATFIHPGPGQSTGYDYTRVNNPTRDELEKTVSSLEHAYDTMTCTNGMAAIGLCLEFFFPGDHIICTEDLYGGSVRMFDNAKKQRGLSFTYVDTADEALVEQQITEHTKAIYVETPSNPTMRVTDLRAMRRLADRYGLYLIVDNTFLTPYLQKPIDLGADMVIHSGTKYLGGHNDTLAGFLCVKTPELSETARFYFKTNGCCLSPFDSFLILRGIKTLPVRMDRQQSNAQKIAQWLKEQKNVEQVYYTGLPEHPGYEVNKAQAKGPGAMISFRVKDAAAAKRALEKVQLISFAESLGGVETLLTYPTLQTHGDVPAEVKERLGITDDFLRLSVGIEDVDDLIADLAQALE
ncbi:MAG: PLP-dependent aspartate aminotransferase family protein [Lachnospiraceae bacterium]|nr:PLP-dependent aspartate aminotransferase family protein [Lachnospiraceae bacterium]